MTDGTPPSPPPKQPNQTQTQTKHPTLSGTSRGSGEDVRDAAAAPGTRVRANPRGGHFSRGALIQPQQKTGCDVLVAVSEPF